MLFFLSLISVVVRSGRSCDISIDLDCLVNRYNRTQNRISVFKQTVPCTKTNKTSLCVKQNLIDLPETVDGEFKSQLFGH